VGRQEKRDLGTAGQYVGVGYNCIRKEAVRVCVGAGYLFGKGYRTSTVRVGFSFLGEGWLGQTSPEG
jgi:hypothetical protein